MTARTFTPALVASLMLCAPGASALPGATDRDSSNAVVRDGSGEPGTGPALARVRIPGRQPLATATVPSILQRGPNPCDMLCTVLAYGFGPGGREDAARVRKVLVLARSGYQLSPTRRIALRPRVQRVHGRSMAGFAVRISGV